MIRRWTWTLVFRPYHNTEENGQSQVRVSTKKYPIIELYFQNKKYTRSKSASRPAYRIMPPPKKKVQLNFGTECRGIKLSPSWKFVAEIQPLDAFTTWLPTTWVSWKISSQEFSSKCPKLVKPLDSLQNNMKILSWDT